ncbi:hypothetical protein K490DRAFT_53171 [Saccharata proteae CBS 121410]|uniref:Uncharacterized protein n=1 Tax=Saccharata proteae CBS 121410 TaxID=1314787 RepID=A0A9P4I4K6_9PEZI|nr:hypothetical protein K490DRAFT_53171 [Saccharata proteae CBS 121410]
MDQDLSICPSTVFKDIVVHTAKCSKCNARNKGVLKQCKATPESRGQKRRTQDKSTADTDVDMDRDYKPGSIIPNESQGQRLSSPRHVNRNQRKSTKASNAMPPTTPSGAREREYRQDLSDIAKGPNKKQRLSGSIHPLHTDQHGFPTSAARDEPTPGQSQMLTDQNDTASFAHTASSPVQSSQNVDASRESPRSNIRRLTEYLQRPRPTSATILAGLELDASYSLNRSRQLMRFVQAQRAVHVNNDDPRIQADNNPFVRRPAHHDRLEAQAAREAALQRLGDQIQEAQRVTAEYERALEAEEREEDSIRAQADSAAMALGHMAHRQDESDTAPGMGATMATGTQTEESGDGGQTWQESLAQAATDALEDWKSKVPADEA